MAVDYTKLGLEFLAQLSLRINSTVFTNEMFRIAFCNIMWI